MSTEPDTSATVFDGDVQAVARTYAEAVLNVAAKSGEADAVVGELEELDADLLRTHPRFAGLFSKDDRSGLVGLITEASKELRNGHLRKLRAARGMGPDR